MLHSLEFVLAEGEDDGRHEGDHKGDDSNHHGEHVVVLMSVDVRLWSKGVACNNL